jgi:hypothetical protein
MAWPPKQAAPSSTRHCVPPPEQVDAAVDPGSLVHGDLHDRNGTIALYLINYYPIEADSDFFLSDDRRI